MKKLVQFFLLLLLLLFRSVSCSCCLMWTKKKNSFENSQQYFLGSQPILAPKKIKLWWMVYGCGEFDIFIIMVGKKKKVKWIGEKKKKWITPEIFIFFGCLKTIHIHSFILWIDSQVNVFQYFLRSITLFPFYSIIQQTNKKQYEKDMKALHLWISGCFSFHCFSQFDYCIINMYLVDDDDQYHQSFEMMNYHNNNNNFFGNFFFSPLKEIIIQSKKLGCSTGLLSLNKKKFLIQLWHCSIIPFILVVVVDDDPNFSKKF